MKVFHAGTLLALVALHAPAQLQKEVNSAVAAAVDRFGESGLTADKIAVTVIDLQRNAKADYRGEEPIYPASVVKLFYLAAAHRQMQSGALPETPELDRALRDMIVDSSNDATHLVFESLTGTTDGPELEGAALQEFLNKRNVINRWFAELGYWNINVNQKPWCEGPYGRERQALGANFENRNKLTTNAVARLVHEIVMRRAVSRERSEAMLSLMHRDPFAPSDDPDSQARAFSGKSLPPGSQYYSKAGWTSTTRHDAAYIRLPNGAEYILVIFTVDNAKNGDIIPFVSKLIAQNFSRETVSADLLLKNGRIWTGAPRQPWAEALAIRGDRIIAVGSNSDLARYAGSQVHDLEGRLTLPGFIDGHTHFIAGGLRLLSVDLRDARSPGEFAIRIRDYTRRVGTGRWIQGGDWDHERWPGAPLPTKDLIDRYTQENPVFVQRLDGHMGLVNSVVLRMARITKDTPDPPGGAIVRDAKTGEPTGILKDAAMSLIGRLIPKPADTEYTDALNAAMREAARLGVTSIQDITPWDDLAVYQRFRAAGKLTVRIYARTPIGQWRRQTDYVGQHGAGDEWLRLGGLKGFMDGSLGSTTALFFQPYVDAPNTTGLMSDDNLPEGKLARNIVDADKAGLQCSVHAIGDKANHLLLDYFDDAARRNGPRDRRFRVEHAQHLLPEDIARFGKLGVIASMQPYHAIDDGRWAEKRIGPERIKSSYAFRSLLDSGATLVFGSDWSVAPLSPILGIHAAVTRETLDGKHPNGWVPEQKIGVDEAVRAYTSSAAYAEFAEREKGTLQPGMLADIIVLSQNIFQAAPDEIPKTQVVCTIAGGRVVFER